MEEVPPEVGEVQIVGDFSEASRRQVPVPCEFDGLYRCVTA